MVYGFLAIVLIAYFLRHWLRDALSRPVSPAARHLRHERRALKLTPGQAARIAGVDPRRIRELEAGQPESRRGEAWTVARRLRVAGRAGVAR